MTWLELSFKEWQRRPLRTSVTAAGVAIAVAALFSLLAFQRGYREGVRSELDRLGAHVLVVPKGCPYDAASIALHVLNQPSRCFTPSRSSCSSFSVACMRERLKSLLAVGSEEYEKNQEQKRRRFGL